MEAPKKSWGSEIARLRQLLREGIWKRDLTGMSWLRRFSWLTLRVVVLLTERLLSGRYSRSAAALTFKTLLSLVPFLAFALSVAKGLGAAEALEPLLLDNLAAGQNQVVEYLVALVNRTDFGTLGAVGLGFVIVTVISLIGSAEEAFNTIWGVNRPRAFSRKVADYLSVTVVFPILLLVATGMSATLRSSTGLVWLLELWHLDFLFTLLLQLLPWVTLGAAFTFLYLFLPNTNVPLRPALIGGFLAGGAWLVAQWAYLALQIGVARSNAIYGTLAALPIFLVWLQLSWMLILIGAELVHVLHVFRGEVRERRTGTLSLRDQQILALHLTVGEASRLDAGEPTPNEGELLEALGGLPASQVIPVLQRLVQGGLFQLLEQPGGEAVYVLRHSPDHARITDVLEALEGESVLPGSLARGACAQRLTELRSLMQQASSNLLLRQMVDSSDHLESAGKTQVEKS